MNTLHDLIWYPDKFERLLFAFRQHFIHWDRFVELLYMLRYPSDSKAKTTLGFNIGALH